MPSFTTPIIYIFFNRPDMVRKTFARIREIRPTRLYLVADGPRATKPTDAERCRLTREAVEQMLDWPCEVIRDYSEKNLGSGRRISSAITSALAQLGEAIIIEDDILPHPDFFTFCAEALERYRDCPQIHGISGYNPIGRYLPHEQCAVVSKTHITWGWATWQRAWADFRWDMDGWSAPETKTAIRQYLANDLYYNEIARGISVVEKREVDTWDYQWVYAMLYKRRHAIVSSVNLVENLGFVSDATHTFEPPAFAKGIKTYPCEKTEWPAAEATTDALFDHIYWSVYLGGSKLKISLLRCACKHSRFLARMLVRKPI